jgi:hypothetical protein
LADPFGYPVILSIEGLEESERLSLLGIEWIMLAYMEKGELAVVKRHRPTDG